MDLPIPIIDLQSNTGHLEDPAIANALDRALSSLGFCYLTGHGVNSKTIGNAFRANREFHQLPAEAKADLKINAQHRGYIARDTSTTRTSSVECVETPNRSESLMLMQPVDPSDKRWGSGIFGPNQFPERDLPMFRVWSVEYFDAMSRLALELTGRLAIALGLEFDAFDDLFTDPTIFLRMIHYPEDDSDQPEQYFGSAPHTDHGFLTLVAQDEVGGLEVRVSESDWIAIPPLKNSFVLNVADMLSRLSGGRWRSTPHRVVLNKKPRHSIAFFFDPNFDAMISSRVGSPCLDSEEIPTRYGDYLMSRFGQNYDYRSQGTQKTS